MGVGEHFLTLRDVAFLREKIIKQLPDFERYIDSLTSFIYNAVGRELVKLFNAVISRGKFYIPKTVVKCEEFSNKMNNYFEHGVIRLSLATYPDNYNTSRFYLYFSRLGEEYNMSIVEKLDFCYKAIIKDLQAFVDVESEYGKNFDLNYVY